MDKSTSKSRRIRPPMPDGFDVVCTIGRVEFGRGEESPHVAAFKLIAEHDAPGTFRFPMSDGGECSVAVDYSSLPGAVE